MFPTPYRLITKPRLLITGQEIRRSHILTDINIGTAACVPSETSTWDIQDGDGVRVAGKIGPGNLRDRYCREAGYGCCGWEDGHGGCWI